MNKKLETIEEMASVQQAAKKMKDKNVFIIAIFLLILKLFYYGWHRQRRANYYFYIKY
jgi:hypothetical protein